MSHVERIQLCDDHHHVLLLEGVVEVEDPLVVQLGQQVHLPESQGFPLPSSGDELGSKLGLSLFLSHPLHIGEGAPAPIRHLDIKAKDDTKRIFSKET